MSSKPKLQSFKLIGMAPKKYVTERTKNRSIDRILTIREAWTERVVSKNMPTREGQNGNKNRAVSKNVMKREENG